MIVFEASLHEDSCERVRLFLYSHRVEQYLPFKSESGAWRIMAEQSTGRPVSVSG